MDAELKHLGKYELQERLGQGGMAEVWKALDPQLMRFVAIKILKANLRTTPDFKTRFVREGQAIASLRHPNIVQVHDIHVSEPGDPESIAYMVMDYIEGPTLADYIHHISRLSHFPSFAEIVQIFASISQAIDFAHQHGIIHRDIKPSNILLDSHSIKLNRIGEPILTDFGIVKMLGAETLTATGTSLGTPLYIAPELVQGQAGNVKSDIYALGVVLYEMCTGTTPFRGDNYYSILLQHVNNLPTPPSLINPRLPADLDHVIEHCLAKDPDKRFANATSMTIALAQALDVPFPEQMRSAVSALATFPSGENFNSSQLESFLKRSALLDEYLKYAPTVADANRIEAAGIPTRPVQRQVDTPVPQVVQPPMVTKPPQVYGAFAGTVAPNQAAAQHRKQRIWSILIAILVCLIIGSAIFYRFTNIIPSGAKTRTPGVSTIVAQKQIPSVGDVSFFNTRQLTNTGTPGINDGIQVNLNLPSQPATGQRYYAWLQDSNIEGTSILLNPTVILKQGSNSLAYIDPAHHNLLAAMSQFLITEESAQIVPVSPTLDQKQWRYEGAIPQTRSTSDKFNQLDHLRHLLSGDPTLNSFHLNGGIDYWFLNNIEQLQTAALALKNQQDDQIVRQQLTDIFYYLDGPCAQTEVISTALPTTPSSTTIVKDTPIGLLHCAKISVPGHVAHISSHLGGIVNAPGTTDAQKTLAVNISNNLNAINQWLTNVRTDGIKLSTLNDTQLENANTVRNDLIVQTEYVIDGRIDPQTQATELSASQLCGEIERLATFKVSVYVYKAS
jgi:serine/threonine protein kinase